MDENFESRMLPSRVADSRMQETKKGGIKTENRKKMKGDGVARGEFRELSLVSVRVINAFSRSNRARCSPPAVCTLLLDFRTHPR